MIPSEIWKEICSICGDLNRLTQQQIKQIQMHAFQSRTIDAYLERHGFYDIDLDGLDQIDLIETANRMLGNQEVQDLFRSVETRLELLIEYIESAYVDEERKRGVCFQIENPGQAFVQSVLEDCSPLHSRS